MQYLIHKILEWAEAWAVFIPLSIIFIYKPVGKDIKPLIILTWTALFLNITLIAIADFRSKLPSFLQDNSFCYNIFSILKVVLLGWYLTKTPLLKSKIVFQLLIPAYLLFILYNFYINESFWEYTPTSGAAESIVLLSICISYFLLSIRDDSEIIWMDQPSFFLCIAISFYEATTFFIFLFLQPIYDHNKDFGVITMKIFSICFAVFCVLLAIFFYRHRTDKSSNIKTLTSGNL